MGVTLGWLVGPDVGDAVDGDKVGTIVLGAVVGSDEGDMVGTILGEVLG